MPGIYILTKKSLLHFNREATRQGSQGGEGGSDGRARLSHWLEHWGNPDASALPGQVWFTCLTGGPTGRLWFTPLTCVALRSQAPPLLRCFCEWRGVPGRLYGDQQRSAPVSPRLRPRGPCQHPAHCGPRVMPQSGGRGAAPTGGPSVLTSRAPPNSGGPRALGRPAARSGRGGEPEDREETAGAGGSAQRRVRPRKPRGRPGGGGRAPARGPRGPREVRRGPGRPGGFGAVLRSVLRARLGTFRPGPGRAEPVQRGSSEYPSRPYAPRGRATRGLSSILVMGAHRLWESPGPGTERGHCLAGPGGHGVPPLSLGVRGGAPDRLGVGGEEAQLLLPRKTGNPPAGKAGHGVPAMQNWECRRAGRGRTGPARPSQGGSRPPGGRVDGRWGQLQEAGVCRPAGPLRSKPSVPLGAGGSL